MVLPTLPLDSKVALVTGASRGIGRAAAVALAKIGAAVAVNYKTHAQEAEAVCAEIKGMGGRAVAVQADVSIAAIATATGGYVAAARSQVFHRADCKSATTISNKNLVRYNRRDEVIQASNKPCAECRP